MAVAAVQTEAVVVVRVVIASSPHNLWPLALLTQSQLVLEEMVRQETPQQATPTVQIRCFLILLLRAEEWAEMKTAVVEAAVQEVVVVALEFLTL